jgi:hypothetical protein
MKKKRKVIGLCFIFVFTMLLLLSSVVAFEENYWRTYQTTHHQDIQNL